MEEIAGGVDMVMSYGRGVRVLGGCSTGGTRWDARVLKRFFLKKKKRGLDCLGCRRSSRILMLRFL